jgi:HSP20 family protein
MFSQRDTVAASPQREQEQAMPTRDATGWMWQEACTMLERAERIQREFFQLGIERRRGPTWQPPVDIVDRGDEVVIIVALPGVQARDIELRLDGATLAIHATRSLPATGEGGIIRRLEIPYGRFERRIVLDAGSLELQRSELADGCLRLSLRKLG